MRLSRKRLSLYYRLLPCSPNVLFVICLLVSVVISGTARPAACKSLTPQFAQQASACNLFIKPQSVNLLQDHNNVLLSPCLSSNAEIMKTSRRLDSNATIIIPFFV